MQAHAQVRTCCVYRTASSNDLGIPTGPSFDVAKADSVRARGRVALAVAGAKPRDRAVESTRSA